MVRLQSWRMQPAADGNNVIQTRRSSTISAVLAGCALILGPHGGAAARDPTTGTTSMEPRVAVARVADLIEDNYFDSARGHAIAVSLRRAAQSGEFDTLRQPRDLATALTLLLHPLDRHFRVVLSSNPDRRWTGNATSDLVGASAAERRSAYGFRRIEMLPGAIGYLDLQSFAYLSTSARDDGARAAANAALQLVHDADAVIIDLRDNVGGSSDMAAYLVSAFMPPAADVYDVIHWRNGTDSERPTRPYPRPRLEVPLYLLISARTASAAEAAAYTLQATGRAVVVGQTSAGAANVGGIFPIGESLGVFIPIGTPINPVTRSNWEGKGIVPDVVVPAEAALPYAERLALEKVLKLNPDGPQAAYTRDVLEALSAQATPQPGPPLGSYVGVYSGTVVTAAGGMLALRQGNRIPSTLVRLAGDRFFYQNDPSRRVVFERGAEGAITGLRLMYPSGYELWFPARALPLPSLQLPKP
jgi:peptidase S41-like protein